MVQSFAMTTLCSAAAASALLPGEGNMPSYSKDRNMGWEQFFLENWANRSPSKRRVRWIRAQAGAGKTSALRRLGDRFQNGPSAFFFASKTDADRNTLNKLPATIAYQLLQRIPALDDYILLAIFEEPQLLQLAFEEQMQRLVITPLLEASDDVAKEQHIIIVFDALDELDAHGQDQFLKFIPTFLSKLSSLPISLLVSSRPEDEITRAFQDLALASITKALILGEESDEYMANELDNDLADINRRYPYLQELYGMWPSKETRRIMVAQSSGSLDWLSMVMQYIGHGEGKRPDERLEALLPTFSTTGLWTDNSLDQLYEAILNAHAPKDRTSAEFLRFKRRLALLCLPVKLEGFMAKTGGADGAIYRGKLASLTIWAIFGETAEDICASVDYLRPAIVTLQQLDGYYMPEESLLPQVFLPSLSEFIFDRQRCGDDLYYRSKQELRTEIVCKLVSFFSTAEAYDELDGQSVYLTKAVLHSYMEDLGDESYEDLGILMDGINLDFIPMTWPLIFQVFMVACVFGTLWKLTKRPGFPKASIRSQRISSKISLFICTRFVSAELWDVSLVYRTLHGSCTLDIPAKCMHLVNCYWDAGARCDCLLRASSCVSMRNILTVFNEMPFLMYALKYASSAQALQATRSETTEATIFILSDEFDDKYWKLIPTDYDTWVPKMIRDCDPDDKLLRMLWGSLPPLPLPVQDDDDRLNQFSNFLYQGLLFDMYFQNWAPDDELWHTIPRLIIPDEYYRNPRTLQRILALKKRCKLRLCTMPDFLAKAESWIECAKPAEKDTLREATVPACEEPAVPSTTSGVVTEAGESLIVPDAQEQGQSGDLDLGQDVSDSRGEVEVLGCGAEADLDTNEGKDEVVLDEKDRNTDPESVFWRYFVYILLWIVNYCVSFV